MKQKTKKDWVVHALGFPVRLQNVPLFKFRGEWEPDINWNELQHVVLWALAHKPSPLTGGQVRFVRRFMKMTLKEFAALCAVGSHPTVMNWEKKSDQATGMHKSTENLLRARILEALPDELWERFGGESQNPRKTFSRHLHEVSEFESQREQLPLSVLAEDTPDAPLRYAYY